MMVGKGGGGGAGVEYVTADEADVIPCSTVLSTSHHSYSCPTHFSLLIHNSYFPTHSPLLI